MPPKNLGWLSYYMQLGLTWELGDVTVTFHPSSLSAVYIALHRWTSNVCLKTLRTLVWQSFQCDLPPYWHLMFWW